MVEFGQEERARQRGSLSKGGHEHAVLKKKDLAWGNTFFLESEEQFS